MARFIVEIEERVRNTYVVLADSPEDAAESWGDGDLLDSESIGFSEVTGLWEDDED